MSRFRPTYRQLTEKEIEHIQAIKTLALGLETLINKPLENSSGSGRYHSLALTALEECVMWATKAISE